VELRERLAAERVGLPFVDYLGGDGTQQLFILGDDCQRVTLGRGEGCDVRLELDPEVSRVHAELQRLGDDWVVSDDGLSRNGSFVNGERVTGRRRLRDGDTLRCGATILHFREPLRPVRETTRPATSFVNASISPTQRRVLIALCRPLRDGNPYALPATNRAIADELSLSIDAVKGHLRVLFEKLDVEDLPHNQKRARLVERALQNGLISTRELH
jgi:pSer/pThr/pTyr-binding forkhead associated (FHA) protein